MQEAKVIIGIASLCSLTAIIATLVVIPQLYNQINEINNRVSDGVQVVYNLLVSVILKINAIFYYLRPSEWKLTLHGPSSWMFRCK